MGIQISNQQDANSVLGLFREFTAQSMETKNGASKAAYLFPGNSNYEVAVLKGIGRNPIFAQRQGFFRSANDKATNNYVRQVFLEAVAMKLNCAVDDLPKVFKWAGRLDDLKVSDFGKGRPLTARRIDAIMKAVDQIQSKKDATVSEMIEDGVNAEGQVLPEMTEDTKAEIRRSSVARLAERGIETNLGAAALRKVPKFAEATIRQNYNYLDDFKRYKDTTAIQMDVNMNYAIEQKAYILDRITFAALDRNQAWTGNMGRDDLPPDEV